jgi:hypothetical protein
VLALVLLAASKCTPPCDPKEATALVASAFEKLECQALEIISARDLMEEECPSPRCIVEDLCPEGLVLLAAGPKRGNTSSRFSLEFGIWLPNTFWGGKLWVE